MTKLNQVIAVVNGKKTRTQRELTDLHKVCQKPELFNGFHKTYQPLDEEEGETLPPESKVVQFSVDDVLTQCREKLSGLIDVVATQDYANCEAKADVVVDETTVAKDVPVSHLLFLEKQLNDIHTFVDKLPVLDPSIEWKRDDNRDAFVTDNLVSNRTKKVMKNHVKAPATDKHPAQVDVFTEDVVVGHWNTVKLSGAMRASDKKEMLERVEKVQESVKKAREEANMLEVENKNVAGGIFDFILGK